MVCVGVCVCPSHGQQMKYSSAAIDQRCGAAVMDSTALIAPPMPSVSLTRTLLHSHLFVYPPRLFSLRPSRFPLHPDPPPSSTLCGAGTQTETDHSFNEIKVESRGGALRL